MKAPINEGTAVHLTLGIAVVLLGAVVRLSWMMAEMSTKIDVLWADRAPIATTKH